MTSTLASPNVEPHVTPRWRWIFATWLVPALMSVVQTLMVVTLRPPPGVRFMSSAPSARVTAVLDFGEWMTWALLTPAIFALVRRFPLRRGRLWPSVATHVAVALLLTLAIETTWYIAATPFRMSNAPGVFRPGVIRQLYWNTVMNRVVPNAFIYIAVVGVASVLAYQRRLHEREMRAALLESELSSARLQTLKMQLHPHFLFNALHAVTVLIRDNPSAATRMVTQLGELLRLTLARAESAQVALRDELELLRLYLDIEATRFKDRLEIVYEIEPVTLSVLVPDLLLQPLAENAIRHGVSRTRGKARLRVRATREGPHIVIEVHDNGRSFQEGTVRENVGLGSTRRRLATLYGEDQSLTLARSPEEGGCVARVRVPFRTAPDIDAVDDASHATSREATLA